MPLNLKCPNCGQAAVVPTAAINRLARCTACHATYAVSEVLHDVEAKALPPALMGKSRMLSRDSFILGFGLGIPAIAFLVFMTYWFGYRDTWEIDNFVLINESCDAVLVASRQEDDDAAEQAYVGLNNLVEDRTITDEALVARIEQAHKAYAPVGERLAQVRKKQEAREEALRQAQAARTESYLNQRQSTYKGFTESELERIHSKLISEGYGYDEALLTTSDMLKYPDTKAVLRRWLDNN